MAETSLGAFVEVFRDSAIVTRAVFGARALTTIRSTRSLVLADCSSGRARMFGVTAGIHSSEDYGRTQRWAAALADAGFDGVRYLVSHDPRARLIGVALFGGLRRMPKGATHPIPEEVARAAERTFGIRVMPVARG